MTKSTNPRKLLVRLTKDEIALIARVLRDNAESRLGEANAKAERMPAGMRDSTMDFFAAQAAEAYSAFKAGR